MGDSVTIKDWKEEDRPREKMMSHGTSALSDAELLAILLHTGNRDCSAVDLSRTLLHLADNSIRGLSRMSSRDLMSVSGIGPAKAAVLTAVFEIARRLSASPEERIKEISSSVQAAQLVAPLLKHLPMEECWVMYLNRRNRLIGKERISIGGVSSTIMDSRIIIKKAIEKLASSIILVHNHPSGNPKPGDSDIKQTALLKKAAALVDIMLADHIIIAGNRYYSFADEGKL